MKKIQYNKAIRDKIPLVMKRNGASYRVSKLSSAKFKKELLKKVGEEASALPPLRKKDDIANELADTLDVIEAVRHIYGISKKTIRAHQKKAMARKGGFKKRLYLHWAEDTGYRTNERKYLKK